MSPLFFIAPASLLLLMASGKKAKAADKTSDKTTDKTPDKTPDKTTDKTPKKKASGLDEAARIIREEAADILASGDPGRIEEYAKAIEEFFPDAAKDARVIADAIRKARKASDVKPTPSPTPTPEVVPDKGPSKASRQLAADVALMLQNTKPGKEDKGLLTTFSTENNLRNTKGQFDGLYGRRVGICLAERYGIVPPRPPVSWGSSSGGYASVAPDKQLYRASMLKLAKADSARVDEWTAAAAAVKG